MIHDTALRSRSHLASPQRMPRRADNLSNFLVDGLVVLGGIRYPRSGVAHRGEWTIGLLHHGGFTTLGEVGVVDGQFSAEDGHSSPHFPRELVGPDVFLDVVVALVFEPAGFKIGLIGHGFAGDVRGPTGVWVAGPVGLGDVLGVVGKDGVVSVVAIVV